MIGQQDRSNAEEDGFRSSLRDVAAVAERLSPYCATVTEFVEMVQLALQNDGQLRFLMQKMKSRL